MIDGRTVMELPRAERSSAEVTALWDYLARRIERLPARRRFGAADTGLEALGREDVGERLADAGGGAGDQSRSPVHACPNLGARAPADPAAHSTRLRMKHFK